MYSIVCIPKDFQVLFFTLFVIQAYCDFSWLELTLFYDSMNV